MLFVLTFFFFYLCMHGFTWTRFSSQLNLGSRTRMIGWPACIFLAMTPIIAHLMPAAWPEPLVYVFWQVTFTWLGIIFYLFLFQLAFLVMELLFLPVAGRLGSRLSSGAAGITVAFTLFIVGYGFMEASRPLKVKDYQLYSCRLDRDLRIVFVSDVHLGVQKSMQRLQSLKELIQDQEPDLIIFGGDILNDHLEWMQDEARLLSELNAGLGKYGVLGNHEFYAGVDASRDFFVRAGIELLEDRKKKLNNANISLIGISDPAPHIPFRPHQEQIILGLTENLDTSRFNILVSHRPWGFEIARESGVDLHLAGHTHKGQIFPFHLIVRLKYAHIYGLLQKDNASQIVTSGASSWGPPIRVLAPPEIVRVDILPCLETNRL